MASRFRGEEHGKMDDKGRIVIPAPFRRVLAEGATGSQTELILVYGRHPGQCVRGYSAAAFERIEDRVADLPRGSQARTALEREVIGRSRTIPVDESGRIVLPPTVRARCGLPQTPKKGETVPVTLLGQVEMFEIWRTDACEADYAETDALLEKAPDGFDVMRLLDEPDALDGI